MKYRRGYRSENTEYRGASRGAKVGAGAGGLGILGILIALLAGALGGGGGDGGLGGLDLGLGTPTEVDDGSGASELPPRNDFLEFVFDDVQAFWVDTFAASGSPYQEARFVIFDQSVETGGCGPATSAVGPFYCPADGFVYLDQAFFDDLATRFGAPGDFAQAYVIAHELGHHVQNVVGLSSEVRRLQQERPNEANGLSVNTELMADCLAGVWAHSADERGLLERGDLAEGLEAAAAVGDDRIQQAATGQINPHTWTHGSSAQRMEWFSAGFETGSAEECDTFG
ncbi:MAG: neutral zinc metallopeptidase [Actinomycetota bacterium]